MDFLEEKTGKPVLGVVPHIENIGIDDEDSVSLEEKQADKKERDIHIAVVRTPKISNFTDFDCLAGESDVSLYYVTDVNSLGSPDLIMLPGSKNTTEDLLYLRDSGLEAAIQKAVTSGTPLIGICGGYQMLGREIRDPHHTESQYDRVKGMGFLEMATEFSTEKLTSQVEANCHSWSFLGADISAAGLKGYEIHMGETSFVGTDDFHPLTITRRAGKACQVQEGTGRRDGLVFGTYIHGIFDHDGFRRMVINALRRKKGLKPLANTRNVYAEKQRSYDKLADIVRSSLDMDKLRSIMGLKTT